MARSALGGRLEKTPAMATEVLLLSAKVPIMSQLQTSAGTSLAWWPGELAAVKKMYRQCTPGSLTMTISSSMPPDKECLMAGSTMESPTDSYQRG